jgi:hypothetical protein
MPRFRASSRLEGRARACRLLAPRRTPAVVLHAARVPTRSGPPRPPWLLRSNGRVPIKGSHSLSSRACALSRPRTPPPAPLTPPTTRSLLRPLPEVPNQPKLHSRPHRSSSTHTLAGYAPALAGHLAATANAAWLHRPDSLAPTQPQLWPRINQR